MKIVFNISDDHFKAACAIKEKKLNELIREKITEAIKVNPENYWDTLYEGILNGNVEVTIPDSVYMRKYNVSRAVDMLHAGEDDGTNNPNPNAGTLLPTEYGNCIKLRDDYGRIYQVDINELAAISKFQKDRMNRGENPNKL